MQWDYSFIDNGRKDEGQSNSVLLFLQILTYVIFFYIL